MKKSISIRKISSLLFLLALMPCCSHYDIFSSGAFGCYLVLTNNTFQDIIIEYSDGDKTKEQVITAGTFEYQYFGEYKGHRLEQKPSDEFLAEKIKQVTIYRMTNDEKQIVPTSYYDSKEKLHELIDHEFIDSMAFYYLVVNEEMFEYDNEQNDN